jgi:hypothetical protein
MKSKYFYYNLLRAREVVVNCLLVKMRNLSNGYLEAGLQYRNWKRFVRLRTEPQTKVRVKVRLGFVQTTTHTLSVD